MEPEVRQAICSQCAYPSPATSKFCRQCGAPLAEESEFSAADTRNFGRQDAGAYASAPLPPRAPSVVDTFGNETLRHASVSAPSYAAPAPQVGYGYPPAYGQAGYAPQTNQLRTKTPKWKGAVAAVALFLAAGFGAGMNELSHNRRPALSEQDQQRIALAVRMETIGAEMAGSISDQRDRTRRQMDAMLETLRDARRSARNSAEAGTASLLTEVQPVDLSVYDYPAALTKNLVNIPGKELMTLTTKDEFANVVQHYQQLIGVPLLLQPDGRERRAIFQTPAQPGTKPGIIVQIFSSSERRGLWEINVLRSPFALPTILVPGQNPALSPGQNSKDGKPASPADQVIRPSIGNRTAPENIAAPAPAPPPPPPAAKR